MNNIVDNEYRLTKIENNQNGIFFYIHLFADQETIDVYCSNYLQGVYIETSSEKYALHTEKYADYIVAELNVDSVKGLATKRTLVDMRLWVRSRIGNTFVDHQVILGLESKDFSFGYRTNYSFVSSGNYKFQIVELKDVQTKNPLLEESKKCIKNVQIQSKEDSVLIKGEVHEKLLKEMENDSIRPSLCLAWKDGKQIYYFHEVDVSDGYLEYELRQEEMDQLSVLEIERKRYTWLMIDENGNAYKMFMSDKDNDSIIVLPTKNYYAKISKSNDNSISVQITTLLFFTLDKIGENGNSFLIRYKKRTYDFSISSVIATRVNTNLEYALPVAIEEDNDEYLVVRIDMDFDTLEFDFKPGVHQFWIEDFNAKRYPLKLFRKEPITENMFLITKQAYALIGNHFYNSLFYIDSAYNLKSNIQMKHLKSRINSMQRHENTIEMSVSFQKEPFFQTIEAALLLAENGSVETIQYNIENKNSINEILFKIPVSLMTYEQKENWIYPVISFSDQDGREGYVSVENNWYREASVNREVMCFSEIRKMAEKEYVRLWGDHKRGVYVIGGTSNLELLVLTSFEQGEKELILTIERKDVSLNDEYDTFGFNVVLKNLQSEETINCSCEDDAGKYLVPVETLKEAEYAVCGVFDNGMESLLEMNTSTAIFIFHDFRKKVFLEKDDGMLKIRVTNLLLYEDTERRKESQGIIERALSYKAETEEKIWLIGENYGLSARDNGLAFFEYCMAHKDDIDAKVYFITKENNEDYKNLENYIDNVLIYDSPEHIYNDTLAEFYIVSHGIRDVMPSLYHDKLGIYRKPVIYLQHGIAALKKFTMNNKSYGGSIRKFVVSSEKEKEFMIQNGQFWDDEIIVTGLSRYDKLDSDTTNNSHYIWIMPTWRDWLVKSERDFINSSFYNYYSQVLSDACLIEMLRDKGVNLVFCLHIEFEKYRHYFERFENDVVHITDMHEKRITDRIKECSMIVTDYSSLFFDVIYIGKPAVFFQFDQDVYEKYRGSYIDLKTDLPGEVVFDAKGLLEILIDKVEHNFELSLKYKDLANSYFAYRDKCNAERIYSEILKCREEIADEY